MKNAIIVSNKNSLDSLFAKVNIFTTEIELLSHWARYLCVLVNGFIEVSMREISFDYAINSRSSKPIANFVRARIRGMQNWNMDKILITIGAFDPSLRVSVESKLGQEEKDALNSVANNKNKIAHGESVSMSFLQIKEYYGKVLRVIELIESTLNP